MAIEYDPLKSIYLNLPREGDVYSQQASAAPESIKTPSSSLTVYDVVNDAKRIERNTFSHGFSRKKELAFSSSKSLARIAGMFESKSEASFERIPVASFMTDPESSIAVGRRRLKDTFIAVTGSFRESMILSRNFAIINARQLADAMSEKTNIEYAQLPGVVYDRLTGEVGRGDTLLDDTDGVIQLSRQHRVSGVDMNSQIIGINLWRDDESIDLVGEEEVMNFLKTRGKRVKSSNAIGHELAKEAMSSELFELRGYEISPIIKVSVKGYGSDDPFEVVYNTGELRRRASENIKLAFDFRDKVEFREGEVSHSRLRPQVYRMIDAIAGRRLGEETKKLYGDTNFPSLELKKPDRIFFDIETSSNRYLPENKRTITQFALKDDSTKASLSFFNLSEVVRKEGDEYRINYDVLESLPSSTSTFRQQKALIEKIAEAVTKGDFVENDEGLFEISIGDERFAFSLTREQAANRISRFLRTSNAREVAGYNIKEFDIPFLTRYFGGDIFEKELGDYAVYDVYEDLLKYKGFAEGFYGVDLGKTSTLSSIYRAFTGREVSGAHEAGFDVEMVIDIADRLTAMKNTTEKVRTSAGESYNLLYDAFSRLLKAGGRALEAEPAEYYYDYDQFGNLVKYAANMPYLSISMKGREHKGIYGALQESYEGSFEELVASFMKGRTISFNGVDFAVTDAIAAESDLSSRVFLKPLHSINIKDISAVKDVSIGDQSLKSEISNYAKSFIKLMRSVGSDAKGVEYKRINTYSQREIDRKARSTFNVMFDSEGKLKDDILHTLIDRTSKPKERADKIKELAKTISSEGQFSSKEEARIISGLKKASAYLKRMETLEKNTGAVANAKRQVEKSFNAFNLVFGSALSLKADIKTEFVKAETVAEKMAAFSKAFGKASVQQLTKVAKEYSHRADTAIENIVKSGSYLIDSRGLEKSEIAHGIMDVLIRRTLGNFDRNPAKTGYDPVVEYTHTMLNRYAKELNVAKLYTQTLVDAYAHKTNGPIQITEAEIRQAAMKELESSIEEVDSTAKAVDLLKFWFSATKAEDVDTGASHFTRTLLGIAQSEDEYVASRFDQVIDGIVLSVMASAAKKEMEEVSSLSLIDISGRNMFDIVLNASEKVGDFGEAYEETTGPVLEYATRWRSIQRNLGEFSSRKLEEEKRFLGYISDKYGRSMIDAIAGKTAYEETFVRTFLEELRDSTEFANLYKAFSTKNFNEEGIVVVTDFLLKHADSMDATSTTIVENIKDALTNSFIEPNILQNADTRAKLVGGVAQVLRDRYYQAYSDMGRSSIEWTAITPIEIAEVAKQKDFLVEESLFDSITETLMDRSYREQMPSTKFPVQTDIEKLSRVFAGFAGEYSESLGIDYDTDSSSEYIADRLLKLSKSHREYGFETPEELLSFLGGYGQYEKILDADSEVFGDYSAIPILKLVAANNDDFKISSTSTDLLQQQEMDMVEYEKAAGFTSSKTAIDDEVIENIKKRTALELNADKESVRLVARQNIDSKIVMDIGEVRTIEPSFSVRTAMSAIPRNVLNALKINFTESGTMDTDAAGTTSEKYRKYMSDALDAITYVFQSELGNESSDLDIARAMSIEDNYTDNIIERIIRTTNKFFYATMGGSVTNAEVASGKETISFIAALDNVKVSAEFLPDTAQEAAGAGVVQIKLSRGENMESIISMSSNKDAAQVIVDRMSDLNKRFNDLDYASAVEKIELLRQAGILKESPLVSGSARDIFDRLYKLRNSMFGDDDMQYDYLLLDSLAEEYEKDKFLGDEIERLSDEEIEAMELSDSKKYADDLDVRKEVLTELEQETDTAGKYTKEMEKIYGNEYTELGSARPFQEYKRNIQLRSLYTPGASVVIAGEKGDKTYTVVEPVFGLPVLEDKAGQRYMVGIGEHGIETMSMSMRTILRQLLPNSGQYISETQSIPSRLIDAIHTATADYFDEYIQEQRRLNAKEVVRAVKRTRLLTNEEALKQMIDEKSENLEIISHIIKFANRKTSIPVVSHIDITGNMGQTEQSTWLEELSESKEKLLNDVARLNSQKKTGQFIEETVFEKTIEFPEPERLPPERLLATLDIIREAFERIEPSEIIEGRKGSQAVAETILDIHKTAERFETMSKEIMEMVELFDEKTLANLSEGARTFAQSMIQTAKRQTQAAQYIGQGAIDAASILNTIGDNIREFFDDMKNGEYTEAAYANFIKMLSDTYAAFYASYGQTQDIRIGSAEYIERGLEGIRSVLSQFVRDGKVNTEVIEGIQKIVETVAEKTDETAEKHVEEKPVTSIIEDFKRIFKNELLSAGEKKALKTAGIIGGGILATALTVGAISRAKMNRERESAEMNAASQIMPANKVEQFVPTSPDLSMYMNSNYGLDSSAIASVALSRAGQNSKVSIIGR